jgi:hypothetical protein
MLRSLSHIALVLVLLTNGMNYTLIQAHFYLNREAIAELFCINQDSPELECNGLCQLDKKLNEAEKQEKEKGAIYPEESPAFYLLSMMDWEPLGYFNFFKDKNSSSVQDGLNLLFGLDFFHPPQCS